MDLRDPTRSVTPTLDGPVLAVLAEAGRPLTVGDVAAASVRGSEIGIRRSLARLVEQGIVTATEMGRNRVHELNGDHVAAPIAELLGRLRLDLWQRFRASLGSWKPGPLYASVFGSAARGDGGLESDIDLLLVHRPFPTDKRPRAPKATMGDRIGDVFAAMVIKPMIEAEVARWENQIDALRRQCQRWTGNALQVVDLSMYEWLDHRRRGTPLLDEITRDEVVLVRPAAGRPKQARSKA